MKGIIKRGVIFTLAALLLVMPFSYSVHADGFDEQLEDTMYRFWEQYKFNVEQTEHISLRIYPPSGTNTYSTVRDSYENLTHQYNVLYKSASVPSFSAFSMNAYLRCPVGYSWIIFGTNKNILTTDISCYGQRDQSALSWERVNTSYLTSLAVGNNYIIALRIHNTYSDYQRVTVDWSSTLGEADSWIMPLFVGLEDIMPNNLKFLFGIPQSDLAVHDSGLTEIVEDGNSTSASAGSTVDSASSDLSTATDQLHSIESGYLNDINVQMNNIDFTGSGAALINNGSFLSTANWVRTQYNRMITGNVFGTLIYFSLVLGLSLLVLGKLRK